MTTFPGSPRLLKGAIVGLERANPMASVVVFQFNPDSMAVVLARDRWGQNVGLRFPCMEALADE